MKRLAKEIAAVSAFLVASVFAGCATPPPAQQPPASRPPEPPAASRPTPAPAAATLQLPKPEVRMKTAAEIQLDEGIALFDTGDFNGSIKKPLSARDLWSAPAAVQTQGFKYLAFSYCVTKQLTLCRQQFEKALKLDPSFDLAPAEKTHPIWGPQFDRAKNPKPAAPKAASSGTAGPAPTGAMPKQPTK